MTKDRLEVAGSLLPGEALLIIRDPDGTDYVSHMRLDTSVDTDMPLAFLFQEGLSAIADCKRRDNDRLLGEANGAD
jgi:hypothetical protein